jgi:DNA-binding CsgD family transcriptional regulator/tetratricopeptide (TPR) repeat protein
MGGEGSRTGGGGRDPLRQAGVTRREGEVLAALAERLSNGEIAERLFISERTVESHVSSLLRKLKLDSRVKLATLARSLASFPPASDSFPLPLRTLAHRGPFVGRAAQWERLRRAWGQVESGERRVVFLAGEAGIGKSRLAAELASVVHAEGAVVLFGRCDEEALAPYQPFTEALRHLLAVALPGDVARVLARVGPELARVVPGMGDVARAESHPATSPEVERYRVFEAVDELLTLASAGAPALLVVDDLHWADRPTVLLLRHLARNADRSALLIVAAYREEEFDERSPLGELLSDLRRERGCDRLVLGGLGVEEVDALLGAAAEAGVAVEGRSVAEAVHAETEGNPFFVGEMIRHLMETGAMVRQGHTWRLDRAELGIPEGVRGVVARRLSRLPSATSGILELAAVIGREFEVEVLAAADHVSPDEVLAVLEPAERARLLVPVDARSGRFAFVHALVRSTLYEELPASRRARLHGQVGEALHARGDEGDLSELARHFCAAGPAAEPARAVHYACLAAEQADHRLAYEPAATFYAMALDELSRLGPRAHRRRVDLLLAQGDAYRRAGQNEGARAAFLGALEIARPLGDPVLLAQAALGVGEASDVWGLDDMLVEALEEALRGLGEGYPALRARLLARLAQALYYDEDSERRSELSRQAVETARRSEDQGALAAVLSARHVALWGPDDLAERTEAAEEILRLAETAGDRELALRGHAWLVADRLERGDLAGVDREMAAHAELAQELRQPAQMWDAAVWRGMRAILEGRFDDAEREAEAARMSGERAGHPHAALGHFAHRFWIVLERGRREELEALAAAFDDLARAYPNLPVWRAVGWRAGIARVDTHLGRDVTARAELESLARREFVDIPRDALWMVALVHLAAVCTRLGDQPRAQALYDLLCPYAGRLVVVDRGWVCNGAVSYYLGLLAATMHRIDVASRHFDEALALLRRIGARPLLARAQFDYARAFVDNGRGADVAAEALAHQALCEAEALGQSELAAATRSLLDRIAVPRR